MSDNWCDSKDEFIKNVEIKSFVDEANRMHQGYRSGRGPYSRFNPHHGHSSRGYLTNTPFPCKYDYSGTLIPVIALARQCSADLQRRFDSFVFTAEARPGSDNVIHPGLPKEVSLLNALDLPVITQQV